MPMDDQPIKILLVEDNPGDARLLHEMVRGVDTPRMEWRQAERLAKALTRLEEEDFDLILLDLGLPDSNGIDTFDDLHDKVPHVPVIVLTGTANEDLGAEAVKHAAQDYLVKGQLDTQQLMRSIRYAIARGRVQTQQHALADRLEQVVAERTQELAESEENYRTLVENSLQGLVVAQGDPPRIVFANQTMGRMLGYTPDEITAMSAGGIQRLFHAEDRDRFFDSYRVSLDGEDAQPRFEFRAHHRDGTVLWLDQSVAPIMFRGSPAVQATFVDVTERRQAEDGLAAEKERLAVTLASIGEGVIATDTEGTVILINDVAQNLTGWPEDEAMGSTVEDVLCVVEPRTGKARGNPVGTVLEATGPVEFPEDSVLVDLDGGRHLIVERASPIRDWEGNILGVVMVFHDVSKERQLEEERGRNQRIESLGILAGGIAHDFNNILTGILGNVNLARVRAAGNDGVDGLLGDAEKALDQASKLVRKLMSLTQGGAPVKESASIAEIITESAQLALSGSNVSYEFDSPDDLWNVDVDPSQMSQVVYNLVLNAEQSMPGGGTVEISARNIGEIGSLPLDDGNYVQVTIRDHGVGMPPDFANRIFDPYFTTKQKGSGLGLTVAYTSVQNHGGAISVDSEPGSGTAFHIYLPASFEPLELDLDVEDRPSLGTGRILVMDDEEMVRTVCAEILRHLGYEVVAVEDGEPAVERYLRALKSDPFDVVILDLTVPGGMGGARVLEEIIKHDPDARVIASSGYCDDPVIAKPSEYGFIAALTKPYTATELGRIVGDVLERGRS